MVPSFIRDSSTSSGVITEEEEDIVLPPLIKNPKKVSPTNPKKKYTFLKQNGVRIQVWAREL